MVTISFEEAFVLLLLFIVVSVITKNLEIILRRASWRFSRGKTMIGMERRISDLESDVLHLKLRLERKFSNKD